MIVTVARFALGVIVVFTISMLAFYWADGDKW